MITTPIKGKSLSRMQQAGLKRSRGIGVIELIMVAAIVGSILVVVIQQAVNYRTDSTVRNETALLNTISENIRGLYGSSTNYNGLTQAVAQNAKMFPGNMDDGTNVFNNWNGTVTVSASADTDGNANRGFTVTWGAVPEAACTKMASSTTTAAQVTVGSTVVTNAQGDADPASAAAACAGNDTSDIIYLFERA